MRRRVARSDDLCTIEGVNATTHLCDTPGLQTPAGREEVLIGNVPGIQITGAATCADGSPGVARRHFCVTLENSGCRIENKGVVPSVHEGFSGDQDDVFFFVRTRFTAEQHKPLYYPLTSHSEYLNLKLLEMCFPSHFHGEQLK